MADRTDVEALFIQHLAVIERAAALVARRHGFTPDDTEELTSWVKLKLVENDYAALRKFRGESSLPTYLNVVVAMLARDYRAQRWGRWRPSASARRLGDLAIRLETLVNRNGLPLQQAAEWLRTAGLTTLSDLELAGLLRHIPRRTPLRPIEVSAETLTHARDSASADTPLEVQAMNEEREHCRRLVEQALAGLPAEDRLIIRLRFWEDLSVADIARGLSLKQKPLYRRIERLLAELEQELLRAGLRADHLHELLDEPAA